MFVIVQLIFCQSKKKLFFLCVTEGGDAVENPEISGFFPIIISKGQWTPTEGSLNSILIREKSSMETFESRKNSKKV